LRTITPTSLLDGAVLRNITGRRLLYGPYVAPEVRIGDELFCGVHGLQVVMGWYGPKQWPKAKAKGGRPRLIVCGDLRRALELETRETISLHWGVSSSTVAKWRKKLGLEKRVTLACSAYRGAAMRCKRAEQPEKYVFPGSDAISHLSPAFRSEVGRRVAGSRAWSSQELEALQNFSNSLAVHKLNRSLSSIKNARQRYKIPLPASRPRRGIGLKDL